ncbi:MAG: hypothetical protein QHJ73_05385 [Armatimonadota bacterium]|nr:hypothetical protein [Armatimonadota bacterium]
MCYYNRRMSGGNPFRWRKWAGIVLAVSAGVCSLLTALRAAESPSSARPEVLVLVSAPSNGVDRVAIAYARAVGEKEARRDLDQLLRLTGWSATDVVVDTRAAPGGKGPSDTVLEFAAPAVVPYPGGMLPVSPFVLALKRHRSLLLVFQTDRPYRFDGPAPYESRHLTIRLQQSPGLYRYDVSIRDTAFETLPLRAVPRPAAPARGTAGKSKRPHPALVLGLALGVAASVGVAVYFIIAGRATHGARRPPMQR